VAEIGLAPFAAIGRNSAAVNTVVAGRCHDARRTPAVAAFIHSKLARFFWSLKIRAGVIQGFYSHQADDDAVLTRQQVQKLMIPRDYSRLMEDYRNRKAAFLLVEEGFMETLSEADRVVYEAFGMTSEQSEYIEKRLSSFPLDRMRPRYPWQAVKPRSLRSYRTDRFA
jgi:hypothetical protein